MKLFKLCTCYLLVASVLVNSTNAILSICCSNHRPTTCTFPPSGNDKEGGIPEQIKVCKKDATISTWQCCYGLYNNTDACHLNITIHCCETYPHDKCIGPNWQSTEDCEITPATYGHYCQSPPPRAAASTTSTLVTTTTTTTTSHQGKSSTLSTQNHGRAKAGKTSSKSASTGLIIGLAVGIVVVLILAVIVIIVIYKRLNHTSDAGGDLLRVHSSNTTREHPNVYSNIGSVFIGHQPTDTHNLGGNPDYDYIDLDQLDMPQGQSHDTAMTNGSVGGPYNTTSGPALPEREPTVKSTCSDEEAGKRGTEEKQNGMVMVDNDDYDGIGSQASGMGSPGKSDEMVMVDNADYDAVGTEQTEDKGISNSDDRIMVDNPDYEAMATEQRGDGAIGNIDEVEIMENAGYGATGPAHGGNETTDVEHADKDGSERKTD